MIFSIATLEQFALLEINIKTVLSTRPRIDKIIIFFGVTIIIFLYTLVLYCVRY